MFPIQVVSIEEFFYRTISVEHLELSRMPADTMYLPDRQVVHNFVLQNDLPSLKLLVSNHSASRGQIRSLIDTINPIGTSFD